MGLKFDTSDRSGAASENIPCRSVSWVRDDFSFGRMTERTFLVGTRVSCLAGHMPVDAFVLVLAPAISIPGTQCPFVQWLLFSTAVYVHSVNACHGGCQLVSRGPRVQVQNPCLRSIQFGIRTLSNEDVPHVGDEDAAQLFAVNVNRYVCDVNAVSDGIRSKVLLIYSKHSQSYGIALRCGFCLQAARTMAERTFSIRTSTPLMV